MFKVVLVDDEVYARQGLRQFTDWAKYGFTIVAEASNGEEALDVIEATNPDLVVTDIRMPVLDGLELIQAVKERKLAEPSFIIVSGYNDFKYAQQAVRFGVKDFILKPIDEQELEKTLQLVSETLQRDQEDEKDRERTANQASFERFLAAGPQAQPTPELIAMLGLPNEEEFCYFDVELNDLSGTAEAIEGQWRSVLTEAVEEIVRRSVVPLYERQRGVYGFVVGRSAWRRGDDSWRSFAESLQRRLRDSLGAKVVAYAGKPVAEPALLQESFRTAGEALTHKYATAGEGPVLYEEIEDQPVKYMELDEGLYTRLIEAVDEHDLAGAQAAADDMFSRFQTERYAAEAVNASITRCVIGVVRIIQSLEGKEQELEALEPVLTWSQAPTSLEGLKALFDAFLREAVPMIVELRKNSVKGSIQKVRQYIETHYHQNISLKSIAAIFYMNPVYLGQLFKKTYGSYFNEFLLQIRIHEAKRLLRQTELRIYEIADKVGFNNSDYFVTQFEKVEGKTPSEYRNALYAKK
ncbi:response regulator transcription factor [Paenibacillus sp. TRM 82003]|nr:response regulator transcription factor [Paenibacillus sp. TRM 82003]